MVSMWRDGQDGKASAVIGCAVLLQWVESRLDIGMIEPQLPNKPRGVPRVDDRRVLSGIFWELRSRSSRPIPIDPHG